MTREEAIKELQLIAKITMWNDRREAVEMAIKALEDRPTVDKEYLIDLIQEAVYDGEACAKLIDLVDRPTVDCTKFMEWLKEEVLDEENWELNAVANGEVICRKFKKMGWLDVEDGFYVDTRPTGWIPVSERLPAQTGEYLVTVSCEKCTWTDKFGYTPTNDGGWYDLESPNQNIINWNDCVIAWMPLPEPYREDGEE